MTIAFPLQWPEGWPRTPAEERSHGWQFKQFREVYRKVTKYGASGSYQETVRAKESGLVTFAQARDKFYAELNRLGAKNVVISSNHKPDRHGVPIESKRSVGDDGVAVYFLYRGKSMAMACDRFDNAAANMRSLGLAIDAMRQLDRHGGGAMMERAFAGFAALPSPGSIHWSSVLNIPREANRDDIEAAYRRLAQQRHPDRGGSDTLMAELNVARAQALAERAT
jgi:hypothetical protein